MAAARWQTFRATKCIEPRTPSAGDREQGLGGFASPGGSGHERGEAVPPLLAHDSTAEVERAGRLDERRVAHALRALHREHRR
jgi:hypothetical protein